MLSTEVITGRKFEATFFYLTGDKKIEMRGPTQKVCEGEACNPVTGNYPSGAQGLGEGAMVERRESGGN